MKWPWARRTTPTPNSTIGVIQLHSVWTGVTARVEWEGDRRAAFDEAVFRVESTAGMGMAFNGCPRCGMVGHTEVRHL